MYTLKCCTGHLVAFVVLVVSGARGGKRSVTVLVTDVTVPGSQLILSLSAVLLAGQDFSSWNPRQGGRLAEAGKAGQAEAPWTVAEGGEAWDLRGRSAPR